MTHEPAARVKVDICQECQSTFYLRYEETSPGRCLGCQTWYEARQKAAEQARLAAREAARVNDAKVTRHNERVIQVGQTGTLTLQQWKQALAFFDETCAYCGGPYQELEHVIPVSKGGGTVHGNCVPACKACNSAKRSKLLEQCASLFDREYLARVQADVARCQGEEPGEHAAINKACRYRGRRRAVPIGKLSGGGPGTRINRYGKVIIDHDYPAKRR